MADFVTLRLKDPNAVRRHELKEKKLFLVTRSGTKLHEETAGDNSRDPTKDKEKREL